MFVNSAPDGHISGLVSSFPLKCSGSSAPAEAGGFIRSGCTNLGSVSKIGDPGSCVELGKDPHLLWIEASAHSNRLYQRRADSLQHRCHQKLLEARSSLSFSDAFAYPLEPLPCSDSQRVEIIIARI